MVIRTDVLIVTVFHAETAEAAGEETGDAPESGEVPVGETVENPADEPESEKEN